MGNAISKGPKADHGIMAIGRVGEFHFHDSNTVDHWRRDGRYEKENRGCEQEESANMMEEASFRHIDSRYLCIANKTIQRFCLFDASSCFS